MQRHRKSYIFWARCWIMALCYIVFITDAKIEKTKVGSKDCSDQWYVRVMISCHYIHIWYFLNRTVHKANITILYRDFNFSFMIFIFFIFFKWTFATWLNEFVQFITGWICQGKKFLCCLKQTRILDVVSIEDQYWQ